MPDSSRAAHPRLAPRLLLSFGAFALIFIVAEVALRVGYRLTGAALYQSSGRTSEEWERRWAERTKASGSPTMQGFDQYHPQLGWSLKPGLRAHRFAEHPPVTTNAQGWRADHDFVPEKPPGRKRIAVLGDSFTFGEDIGDDDTWPARLQTQLENVEVMNFGIHGYGTDQQLLVLEQYALDYRPDVVILGFFVEDIERNGVTFRDYAKPMFVLESGELILTNTPVPTPEQLLARASGAGPTSYVMHVIDERLVKGLLGVRERDVVLEESLHELTRAILTRMHEATTNAGAQLMVVVIPSPRGRWTELESRLARWGASIGYPVIELRTALREAREATGQVGPKTFHFTVAENRATAAAVAAALREQGWLALTP